MAEVASLMQMHMHVDQRPNLQCRKSHTCRHLRMQEAM
jgi:hypothetical protein